MPFILSLVLALQLFFVILSVPTASAEAVRGSLFAPSKPLVRVSASGAFVGRAEGGMFAMMPKRQRAMIVKPTKKVRVQDISLIRAIIQEAESRRDGYDAVQHGARIKPAKRPTEMTLGEIFAWIDATPGQPHAIGRYQFVPQTLRRVVAVVGARKSQRFSPALQDELSDVLLVEAGLNKFRSGTLERQSFMNNLAKIWAGLPNSSGKSHYHGYAGNKASVSWSRFEAVMARLSPQL